MVNAAAGRQGRGAYPVAEAARLAHMRPLTVRRWVEGYAYNHRGERRRSKPIQFLSADIYSTGRAEGRGGQSPVLDFEQLLTLLLVRAFYERGLSLPKIKKAAAEARERYGVENPFVSKKFRSDGNKIFIDLAPAAHGKERQLIDLLSRQREFRELVEPSLFRDVVFVDDEAGEWWPRGLDKSVMVSPFRQFGAPHIAGTGVRTDVVADLIAAEGGGAEGKAAAAQWFGLTPKQVEDAVRFEEWLQTPKG